jgi:hypothetical protein
MIMPVKSVQAAIETEWAQGQTNTRKYAKKKFIQSP